MRFTLCKVIQCITVTCFLFCFTVVFRANVVYRYENVANSQLFFDKVNNGRSRQKSLDKTNGDTDGDSEFTHRKPRSAKQYDVVQNQLEETDVVAGQQPETILENGDQFQEPAEKAVTYPTQLSDIFISVKSSLKFHKSRLTLLLDTWISLAKHSTYIFTDSPDVDIQNIPGIQLIDTRCSSGHNRQSLCCKMASEYDYFLQSGRRWFCHVDDDTYVNVPRLVTLLQSYNHTADWYLGRPSLQNPLEILDKQNEGQKLAFWFATGGAGFCISQALAKKMIPHASGGRLQTVGERIRLPDDCTIGFVIEHLLGAQLTVLKNFHSHLEALTLLKPGNLANEVTFSYGEQPEMSNRSRNVVNVPGFSLEDDPTRFRSLHCHLHPQANNCDSLKGHNL